MGNSDKVFKKNIKKIAPYVVGGVLAVETCSLLGFTPLHLSETEKTVDIMEEISNNNFSKTTVIENAKGFDNVVQGYSKWVKKGDSYYREVSVYNGFDNDEILDMIVSQEDVNLRDLLGAPDIVAYEKNNYVSEEELLNNKDFVKATIFKEDAWQVIEKETMADELVEDLASFFILSFGLGIPYAVRRVNGDYSKSNKVKKLSRK